MNNFSDLMQELAEYEITCISAQPNYVILVPLIFFTLIGAISGLVFMYYSLVYDDPSIRVCEVVGVGAAAVVSIILIWLPVDSSPVSIENVQETVARDYKLTITDTKMTEITHDITHNIYDYVSHEHNMFFFLNNDEVDPEKRNEDPAGYYDYKGIKVTSLRNDGNIYTVYIIKQPDDTWALCSLDNTGTYTPLPTDGTAYQTLKERSE